jgi:hypothetical protein
VTDFEPGWLMRTCHEAHISCMLDHNPAALQHLTKQTLPISETEARELYDGMNARFKKWTGMDLSDAALSFTSGVRNSEAG